MKCHTKTQYNIHRYLYNVTEQKFSFIQIFQNLSNTKNIFFAEQDTSLKYLNLKNEMNDVTLFYG